jgi:hypothetical protein
MPTKKYCEKCKVIGPKREEEVLDALVNCLILADALNVPPEEIIRHNIDLKGIAMLERMGKWPHATNCISSGLP